MKLQFGLRGLLGAVAIVAGFAAAFYYLHANIVLALLVATVALAPLSLLQSPQLNALFWSFAGVVVCYLVGILGFRYGQPALIVAMPMCWFCLISYGLRRQPELRRNLRLTGSLAMVIGFLASPPSYRAGDDMDMIATSLLFTLVAALLTVFAAKVYYRDNRPRAENTSNR